ncbi:MAG TPA: hypothetical protein VF273_04475 [Pelobium sp.]
MSNLKTISFSILIDSSRETVWDVLWNHKTYPKWTNAFCAGNYYEGTLEQGATIKFLKSDGEGMTSYIQKLVDNEHIAFIHQAGLENGIEKDFEWQGAREIYNFKKETDACTELQVIVDVSPEMEQYFNNTFPKALQLVKQMAEERALPSV